MKELRRARERYRERQEALSHFAKKSLGQNFLVSDHVIQKILLATKDFQYSILIEIGPGLGALTDGLKILAKELLLIELDHNLAEYWREQKLNVIEADALQMDWQNFSSSSSLLVSNLPYQISSSLVVERSLDAKPLMGMILMFQKEVAQRIRANVDEKNYGFLSALAQSFWEIDFLLEASSHDFSPPPKVASRVLIFRPIFDHGIQDKRSYLLFLKACFSQPRKYMLSNLSSDLNLDKNHLRVIFEKINWDTRLRAGQVSVKDFKVLYEHLRDKL